MSDDIVLKNICEVRNSDFGTFFVNYFSLRYLERLMDFSRKKLQRRLEGLLDSDFDKKNAYKIQDWFEDEYSNRGVINKGIVYVTDELGDVILNVLFEVYETSLFIWGVFFENEIYYKPEHFKGYLPFVFNLVVNRLILMYFDRVEHVEMKVSKDRFKEGVGDLFAFEELGFVNVREIDELGVKKYLFVNVLKHKGN